MLHTKKEIRLMEVLAVFCFLFCVNFRSTKPQLPFLQELLDIRKSLHKNEVTSRQEILGHNFIASTHNNHYTYDVYKYNNTYCLIVHLCMCIMYIL